MSIINNRLLKFYNFLKQYIPIQKIITCLRIFHAFSCITKINYLKGFSANYLAKLYRNIGDLKEAHKFQEIALVLAEKSNDFHQLVIVLIDFAIVKRDIGRPMEAKALFLKSLKQVKSLKRPEWEIECLRNLAYLYIRLGKPDAAKCLLEKAEKNIASATKKVLSDFLACYGNYYDHIGNIQKASDYYHLGLSAALESGYEIRQATLLGDLATVNLPDNLNNYELAKSYLEQALKLSRKIKYVKCELSSLSRLANLCCNQSNFDGALKYYAESYNLAKKYGFIREQADALNGLSDVYLRLNRLSKAVECVSTAKELYKGIEYGREIGFCLEKEGNLYLKLGSINTALEKFTEALEIFESILFINNKYKLFKTLGLVYETEIKDYQRALSFYIKSVNSLEEIRNFLKDENKKLYFTSTNIDIYTDIVRTSLSLLEKALLEKDLNNDKPKIVSTIFKYIESSKSRSLLDFIGMLSSKNDNFEFKKLIRKKEALESVIQDILLNNKDLSSLNKKNSYSTHYKNWQEIISLLNNEYKELFSMQQTTVFELSDIQAKYLGHKETILEYFVCQEKIVLLIIKKDLAEYKILDITKTQLLRRVAEYLAALTDKTGKDNLTHFESDLRKIKFLGNQLFETMLSPATQFIEKQTSITIIPHEFLHNFPFHTLFSFDNDSFFLDNYLVSYCPSSTIFAFCKNKNTKQYNTFLGIANPTTKGFRHLKIVEEEVKSIVSIMPNSHAIPVTRAAKSSFISESNKFNIIHLACHGEFNIELPLSSCLFLADSNFEVEGMLKASEILELNLSNCNLVTLSACKSGTAQILLGDELMGLIRAFFYAGVPSMIVSLWDADDSLTFNMMKYFYTSFSQSFDKIEALRKAQLLIKKEHEHPFLWGNFTLIGDPC